MTPPIQAPELDLAAVLDTDAAYDPLAFIEGEDTEDWIEQNTSVLLPKPLPSERTECPLRVSIYSPERAGGAVNAVRDFVTTNAGRRHILLSIIDWARDGIAADELFKRIEAEAAHNLSVYDPMAYCAMLERAGALTLETPEAPTTEKPAASQESSGEDLGAVAYRTIDSDVEHICELKRMQFPTGTGNESTARGFTDLFEYLRSAWQGSVTELAIDYARTFIGNGTSGYRRRPEVCGDLVLPRGRPRGFGLLRRGGAPVSRASAGSPRASCQRHGRRAVRTSAAARCFTHRGGRTGLELKEIGNSHLCPPTRTRRYPR